MTEDKEPRIYTLPAGIPFADALADKLLSETSGDHTALTKYRILLPTRRACRNLRDSFLRLSGGKPLLLPQMQPIGDVDEDSLDIGASFTGKGTNQIELPPAIAPLQRKLMLARMIMAMDDFVSGIEQAVALAESLGRLMDQIHTENLSLDDLPDIVADKELAKHWEVTVEFLEILSKAWPAILEENGMIDAAERRNALVLALADHWEENPPQTPVIAAGSTGSIPATARLLSVISRLPQGSVVLPGLDLDMDQDSWDALDDTHPQATLKSLITDELGTDINTIRNNVAIYDHNDELITQPDEPLALTKRKLAARRKLISEIMRPADTSKDWINLSAQSEDDKAAIEQAIGDLSICECETQQEEALVIAMHLRAALADEEHRKRAILITPDRNLARRVAVICKRWNVEIDDSAGYSLGDSPVGGTMIQAASLCINAYQTGNIASVLKQPHMYIPSDLQKHLVDFETHILRGPKIAEGLDELRRRIDIKYDELIERGRKGYDKEAMNAIIDIIETKTSGFAALCDGQYHKFIDFIDAHIRMTENLAAEEIEDAPAEEQNISKIWQGDDGEAAALFLADLRQHAHNMPDIRAEDYLSIWENLTRTVTVRPAYGMHPRLAILGQLEARLVHADLIILAGLNESTWPPEPSADPWMSRPMRKTYGLPSPERGIGLSAHDFAQAFCHRNVVLTRAKRVDRAPTTPARWLQRMDTVLSAYGIDPEGLRDKAMLQTARQLDHTGKDAEPVQRPAPTPPAEKRPDQLYVTAIEKWMRDPYSIYARYILGLRKLDDLEEEMTTAKRGNIIHEILEEFINDNMDRLPDNAREDFLARSREIMEEQIYDRNLLNFWWPRIIRFADWFIPFENQWREDKGKPVKTEAKGHTTLDLSTGGTFKLSAKADRIDKLHDGSLAVVDYKSGKIPSNPDIESGFAPQITATGYIAAQGGFSDIDNGDKQDIGYLGFWPVSGGHSNQDKDRAVKQDTLETLINDAANGITKLAEIFSNPETPYYSLPRLDKAPPKDWQDYGHLARVQEWAALGEEEDAA